MKIILAGLINRFGDTIDAYGTSFNSTLSTIVQLIGMVMAGVIIGTFGIGSAIAVDAVFLLSVHSGLSAAEGNKSG